MQVDVVEHDDYVAVYVGGQQVWRGHSVDWYTVAMALGAHITRYYIEDRYEAEDFDWDEETFSVDLLPPSTRMND